MSKDNTIFIGGNQDFWTRNRRSEGYLLKRRVKEIVISVVRALLMFGLCFMIIQPMLTRFSMSLMAERDLYDSTIILLLLDPLYLSILCGFFGGGDMNGIALLIPELAARFLYGALLVINVFLFWKQVLPAYKAAFARAE